MTRNRFGKGTGWYVGTVVEQTQFYDGLIAALLKDASIRPPLHPPEGVEVSIRGNGDRRLLFLLNHTEEPRIVPLPSVMRDALSGAGTGRSLTLPRLGVAVLQMR